MSNAPFRFHDKLYKQIDEVVMSNLLASIVADLWMQRKEQKLKFSKNNPTIWLRYVDDIYCLFASLREKNNRILYTS